LSAENHRKSGILQELKKLDSLLEKTAGRKSSLIFFYAILIKLHIPNKLKLNAKKYPGLGTMTCQHTLHDHDMLAVNRSA